MNLTGFSVCNNLVNGRLRVFIITIHWLFFFQVHDMKDFLQNTLQKTFSIWQLFLPAVWKAQAGFLSRSRRTIRSSRSCRKPAGEYSNIYNDHFNILISLIENNFCDKSGDVDGNYGNGIDWKREKIRNIKNDNNEKYNNYPAAATLSLVLDLRDGALWKILSEI